jgi:phage baseplate assembly protein W
MDPGVGLKFMSVTHFRYPFHVTGASVDTLEQDSFDEVAQSVQVILTTAKGERIEVPTFGIDDPVLTLSTVGQERTMLDAINQWDDRAQAALQITQDNVDEFVRHVEVKIPDRPSHDISQAYPQQIPVDASEGTGYGSGGYGIEPWGE